MSGQMDMQMETVKWTGGGQMSEWIDVCRCQDMFEYIHRQLSGYLE